MSGFQFNIKILQSFKDLLIELQSAIKDSSLVAQSVAKYSNEVDSLFLKIGVFSNEKFNENFLQIHNSIQVQSVNQFSKLECDNIELKMAIEELSIDNLSSREIGSFHATIKLIDIDYLKEKSDQWIDKISFLTADSYLVYFYSKDVLDEVEIEKIKNHLNDDIQIVEFYSKDQQIRNGLLNCETLQGNESQKLIHSLMSLSQNKTTLDIINLIKLFLDQEKRSSQGKRVINNQKISTVKNQKEGVERELYSEIRKQLSSTTKALQKNLEESIEKHIFSKKSFFRSNVTQISKQITDLTEEKEGNNVILKVPDNFEKSILDLIRNHFIKYGQENLIVINDTFKELKESINEKFQNEGIDEVNFGLRYLTDIELRTYIDESCQWERRYEGKRVSMGIFDYLQAARRFQMMLFMFASTFGLSFLQNLKIYMLPVSFVMLGLAIVFLYKKIETEKIKSKELEIANARKAVIEECKRIATHFTRSWNNFLKTKIGEIESNLDHDIELLLKNTSKLRKEKFDLEKETIQTQIQNLDNTDKRIIGVLRSIENIEKQANREISEHKIELRNNYRKLNIK